MTIKNNILLSHRNPEITIAEEKARAAEKERKETIKRIQKECKHEKWAEGESAEAGYFSYAKPPFMVCLVCGYAEEGWGIHYKFENDYSHKNRVPRELALACVVGRIIPYSIYSDVQDKKIPEDALWE